MNNKKTSYRSIFKATAILGSVQFFNIIIGVIRNKIVSILLGPAGMGIVGLLQSSSQTISGFTNCGVSTSAVKNVAGAYEKNNLSLLRKVIYVLKRLVAGTGALAILVMLVMSKKLSQWSFGNDDFTISFACLSASLLFSQATQAYHTIIKGCRRINYYAKANVLGNISSLLICIPLYYLWGEKAIVPVLILISLFTFLFAYHYERKIGIKEAPTTKEEFKSISTDILKMGLPLAISEVFPIMASYVIRLHVSNYGGVSDVGLFSAGFAILNGYVGMIFTAMSSDYIPRLSAISDDNEACTSTINSQILLSILILFPILVALVVFGNLVVWILYTKDFTPMVGMIYWGALGMLYKTLNWCYGCILIPKRESRIYFVLSVLSAAFYLAASIVFYNVWSVTGLGVSFLASQLFDFTVGYIFISKKHNIHLNRDIFVYVAFLTVVIISVICLNSLVQKGLIVYIIELFFLLFATVFSIVKLNKIMNLKEFIVNKIKKYKK